MTEAATLEAEGKQAHPSLPGTSCNATGADAVSRTAADPLSGEVGQCPLPSEAVAHLAHELRTPLSAIVSSAELMAEERFGALGDPRYKSYIAGIRSSAQHLLDVVELMLAGGALPAPKAGTDIALIANAAAEHVRALAESNRATITFQSAPGLRVSISPTALRQMLINLLGNAVAHAGLEPVITVRSGSDLDGSIWIEVEDDGPGVSLELAAALLADEATPAAAEAARSDLPKGHGFGLAITSTMARENGAELALLPVVPHGTRARLTFRQAVAT